MTLYTVPSNMHNVKKQNNMLYFETLGRRRCCPRQYYYRKSFNSVCHHNYHYFVLCAITFLIFIVNNTIIKGELGFMVFCFTASTRMNLSTVSSALPNFRLNSSHDHNSMMIRSSFRPFSQSTVSRFPIVRATSRMPQQRRRNGYNFDSNLQMCICIHCARVTNCSAYYFVETKHEQPHISVDPTFTPRDGSPTIHVNVRTVRTNDNTNEINRMWREHAEETKRAQRKSLPLESNDATNINDSDQQSHEKETPLLHGETKYNIIPVTTYEYDVVACVDYVEDRNCWVRNMPDEIKRANPNFVPT